MVIQLLRSVLKPLPVAIRFTELARPIRFTKSNISVRSAKKLTYGLLPSCSQALVLHQLRLLFYRISRPVFIGMGTNFRRGTFLAKGRQDKQMFSDTFVAYNEPGQRVFSIRENISYQFYAFFLYYVLVKI